LTKIPDISLTAVKIPCHFRVFQTSGHAANNMINNMCRQCSWTTEHKKDREKDGSTSATWPQINEYTARQATLTKNLEGRALNYTSLHA